MDARTIEYRGTPCIEIEREGSRAIVALHGAQVLSWIAADGRQRLFLGERAEFGPGKAIRGGIPVIFPQFAARGPWRRHGFARITPWQFDGVVADAAHFTLEVQASAEWPHACALSLAVELQSRRLCVRLCVTNTGATPFEFTAALHSYLRVSALESAALHGLEHCDFVDSAANATPCSATRAPIRFDREVDHIYGDVQAPLTLRDGVHQIAIAQNGFSDVVVWNPGAALAATITDLAPDEYRRFVCVEAAHVLQPCALEPGMHWQGWQTLG